MKIFFINVLLTIIRICRMDWRGFVGCKINGKAGQLWELQVGDTFHMEGSDEELMVIESPVVCWRTGNWGVMTMPVSGEWLSESTDDTGTARQG